MRTETSLMGTLALGALGVEAILDVPEERLIEDLSQSLLAERGAMQELMARLLAVDGEHPELRIRQSLERIVERMKHSAMDPMDDLRALVRVAKPFLS